MTAPSRFTGHVVVAALLVACGDDPGGPADRLEPAQVIVSAPARPASATPTTDNVVSLAPGMAYISMAPGTEPTGTSLRIRNTGSANEALTSAIVDGGLDPVAIAAQPDDSLVVEIAAPDGSSVGYAKVPRRSRPVVLRTVPTNRRTDVVLNPTIHVVFNEPMDAASVRQAVRLRLNGAEVAGEVSAFNADSDVLIVSFVPSEALDPETVYSLAVSTAATSRSGVALAEAVVTEFTTGTQRVDTGAPTAEPEFGSLVIVTNTAGDDLDPDGYDAVVGGAVVRGIGINERREVVAIPAGAHSVALAGVAANCTVIQFPRSILIARGTVPEVPFMINCTAPPAQATGRLVVSVRTGGVAVDPDGYLVRIDSLTATPLASNATVELRELSAGRHRVEITGAGLNCAFADLMPSRVVSVIADATVTETFDVTCTPDFEPSGVLAYSMSTGYNKAAVFTSNADGSNRRQLTDGSAYDLAPTWSPDGQRIAFTRVAGDQLPASVVIMDANGRELIQCPRVFEPSWSPDGTQLVVQGHGINLMNATDCSRLLHPLTSLNGENQEAKWSPIGDELVFLSDWRDPEYAFDLYGMRPDGSGLRPILLGDFGTDYLQWQAPSWSPDGRTIAAIECSSRTYCREDGWLVIVNADGSGRRRIAYVGPSAYSSTSWSPDGTTIALNSAACSCIRFVRTDGTGSTMTIQNAGDPAWRP